MGHIASKFSLGKVVITPAAIKILEESGQGPLDFLLRHLQGDWGELDAQDKRENEFALSHELRLLSSYKTKKGEKIWIITEADRSSTCILLPEDY